MAYSYSTSYKAAHFATSPSKTATDATLISDAFDDVPDPLSITSPVPQPQKRRTSRSIQTEPSERQPLIPRQDPLPDADDIQFDEESDTRHELKTLIRFGLPLFATQLTEATFGITSVITVGHLGTAQLASATLGNLTVSTLALCPVVGFAVALDTLCPQSWTSNPKSCSLHALRTFYILMLLYIPQLIIFWNAESLLRLINQDAEIARLTGQFIRVACFGVPGFATFEVIRRWLQAQGIFEAPTFIVLACAPINIFLNWFLVWSKYGIGFPGAPLATIIVYYLTAILGILYSYFFVSRDAWGGFTRSALWGWGDNIKLGLSGFAMTASEWYAGEVTTLAISYFGPAVLATQSVVGNIQYVTYQLALAISSAAAVRCGNLVGAKQTGAARTASRVALCLGFGFGVFNTILLVCVKGVVAKPFTSDPEVIRLVEEIIPIVAVYQVVDSVTGCAFGVLRGAGRSKQAAILTALGYWVIGVPVGLVLAFYTPLELKGIWIGTTIALAVISTLSSIYIYKMDWRQDVRRALERAAAN